jgi:hypothetical protein
LRTPMLAPAPAPQPSPGRCRSKPAPAGDPPAEVSVVLRATVSDPSLTLPLRHPPPPRANAGARRRPSPRRCVRSPSCLTPRPRLRPAPRLRCRGETCRGEAGEGGTSGASALPGSLVLESFTEPFLICHNTVSLLKPFLICHNTVSLLKPFLICHNTVSLLRGRAPVCVDAASHAVGARAARRGRRAGAGGG